MVLEKILNRYNSISLAEMDSVKLMNRIDSISSSSDVANNTTFVPSEEPAGDNNASIYCTRLIQLENPATQLKVIFDGFKPAGTALGEIKTYFKLLKALRLPSIVV